jgi:hypothetical protein
MDEITPGPLLGGTADDFFEAWPAHGTRPGGSGSVFPSTRARPSSGW